MNELAGLIALKRDLESRGKELTGTQAKRLLNLLEQTGALTPIIPKEDENRQT